MCVCVCVCVRISSVSDWNSATARRLWECWDKRDENTQRQWEAEFLRALTTHLPAAVITSDVNREIAFALMSVVTTGVARPSDCFDAPDVSVVRSSSPSGVHQCLREKKTECYVTRNKTGEQKRDTSESFGVKEGRSVTEQKTERADIRLNQSVRVAPTIETCTDEDEIDSKDDVENGELQLPEENKAEGREEEANEKENEESENAEEDKGKGSDKIPSDSESEEDREGTMFGGRKVTTTTSTKYGDMQVTTTVWPAFSGDNIPPQVKRLLYKVRRKLPSSLASRFNTIASYREMHPYYREMHPYYREDVAYDDDDDDDSDDERNVREAKRYRGRGAGIRFGFGIDVGKRTASFISNAKKGDAIKSESKVRKKSMVTLSLERLDRKEADLRHAETSPSSPPPVPPIIRATVQPKLSVTSKDGGAAKKRKSAMQIQRAPQLVTSARTVLGDYAVPFSFVPISDGGNTNVLSDSGTNVLSDSSNTNVLSGSDNLPDTTQTFLHLSDLRVASPPSPPPSPPQSPNHSVIKSPVPNEPSKSPSPLVQMESSTQPSTTSYLPSHPNATPSTKEVKIAHAKIAVKDVSEVLLKLKLEREAELKVALCKHEEMVRAAEPIVCKYRECRQRSKTIGDTERAYEAECTNACRLIYHVGCWKSLVRDRTLRRDAPCLADKCAGTLVYAATTDKLHIFVARIKTRAGANLGLSHPRLASERSTNSFLPSPPSPSSTDFSTARGSSDNDVRTLRVSESRTKALGRKTARTEPKLAKSECKNATPEAGNANPHDKTIKPRIETINLGIRIAKPESATAKLETEPVKARTKTVKPEAQIAKSETKPAKPSSSASVLASLSSTRQRPAPATTSSSPTIKSESKASTSIPRFRMCDIRPNNSILKPVSQSPTSKAQYPTSARNTTVSMSQCGRGTDEPHAIVATRVTALSRKRSSRHASHNSCNEECDVDIGIEASNGPEIVSSRVFTVCDSPAPMTTLSLSVSDLVPPKRPITRVNAPTSYPHVSPPTQTARIALSTTPTSRPGTIGANACVTDARALSKEVVCVNSKVNASKIQDIEMNSMFVSTRAAQATEIKSFGSHPVTKTLDVVPIFPYHASSAIFSNLPAQRSCVDSLQRDCITSPQSACVTALQKGCATGRTPATSVFVASKNRQRLSTTLNPCLAPVSEITIAAPVHRKTMLPRPRAIGTMLSRPRAIGPSRTAIISPRPLTVITAHHPMTNLGTDTTVTSCQKIRSCYQSAPLCATLSRPHVEPRSPYYHSFPLSQITTPTPFLFSPSIATNATTSSAAYNSPKDEMFIDAVTKRQHWIEISTIPTNMLCLYPLAPDVTTTQLGTYFGSQQWVYFLTTHQSVSLVFSPRLGMRVCARV
jgi:hypothetical protein